jgi:predicted GIY-YIG superfamily endonuclease
MSYGKTIELFLVDGTADSIITAELSNWNGKAIKIPRTEVLTCNRDDIKMPGVYFLFCKDDEGDNSVYIGEAENVLDRLTQHLRDYQGEKEKYYWNEAVIFTGRDLNKALVRYLENRFVEIARVCNRYVVLTKNTYKNTVMKESQIASMEEFVYNVKILINALGYKVLVSVASVKDNTEYLYCQGKNGTDAKGYVTSEGFVVLKGSKVSMTINSNTFAKSGYLHLKEKLVLEKIIVDGELMQDYLFNSPTAAADVVLGSYVSGLEYWRNKEGKSLKDLEQ